MAGLVDTLLALGFCALCMTRERAKKIVDELVKRGEVELKESKALIDKMVTRGEEGRAELRKLVEEELERAKTGLATSKDIEELSAKMDALAEKLSWASEGFGGPDGAGLPKLPSSSTWPYPLRSGRREGWRFAFDSGEPCITRPAPGRIAFSDGIFPIR